MRKLLLGFMVLAVSVFAQTASAAPADFAGPLFGLDQGPDANVLLVADAGQGVVRMSGDKAKLVRPGDRQVGRRLRGLPRG